jgi:hypothetical protein
MVQSEYNVFQPAWGNKQGFLKPTQFLCLSSIGLYFIAFESSSFGTLFCFNQRIHNLNQGAGFETKLEN